MAEPTYRIVKRRIKPKRMKKEYICPACRGTVHAAGRRTIESVQEIHDSSCPATRKRTS